VHSIEPHVDFINAVANDEPMRVVANVPNSGGVIPGLPLDVTVEVPVVASGRGVVPEKVELPRRIVDSVLRPRIAGLEMALEAFKSGGRDVLLDIVHRSHFTRSDEQADAVLDGILSLPFNEEMRKHYS
jgi:alpha-galactosidase/6-phospho-beta-glucosidase family protein